MKSLTKYKIFLFWGRIFHEGNVVTKNLAYGTHWMSWCAKILASLQYKKKTLKCQGSCVMCHVSLVLCHVLRFMDRMSCVGCHLSHTTHANSHCHKPSGLFPLHIELKQDDRTVCCGHNTVGPNDRIWGSLFFHHFFVRHIFVIVYVVLGPLKLGVIRHRGVKQKLQLWDWIGLDADWVKINIKNSD